MARFGFDAVGRPAGRDVLRRVTEVDRPLRLGNHAGLREPARPRGDMVDVSGAHDPSEPARCTDGGASAGTE
ncbi:MULTISPECIES: hypothetical protein [Streptomyces]|uniref:Uncharacterized protein n=1 Tax=Streptomyces kaempferi TaxID=333725 RepID=A0ABW3XU53_9ACTN|nr:hypothetical protein [Streptomyces sp. NBC_01462]